MVFYVDKCAGDVRLCETEKRLLYHIVSKETIASKVS